VVLAWKYYFYAIGNTPTISFTRDLAPRTAANILSLGCGDPRNVLFTIYNEESDSDRPLDITCSDIDPAIIARNVLLFTMILEKDLCEYSCSQKIWADSPYGPLIKFSTSLSLEEARQHMKHYSTTGISSTDSKVLASATLINPTFAYSFVGEGLQAAQRQFGEWCDAYRARATSKSATITLRFLVAEATALVVAPSVFSNANQSVHTGIPFLNGKPSLLSKAEDATKEFAERLFADLGMMALLLGVVPVDYLSGFFSRSNTHEIMLHKIVSGGQFQQVTTWKSPTSSDVPPDARSPIVFDNMQLGTFLWDVYRCMFEDEDSMTFWRKHGHNWKAIAHSDLIKYNRESFVLLLKLIRSNLTLSAEEWEHSVYTVSTYRLTLPRMGRFSEWSSVPQLVRIVLAVPHSVLEDVFEGENTGTPILQCDVQGLWSMNVFSAIHAAFGRVSSAGTRASPRISFEEDKEGWKGRSPLVVSFTMPTQLLIAIEPQDNLTVSFSIRGAGPTAMVFAPKLGITLHVHVMPEPNLSSSMFNAATSFSASLAPSIGPCGRVTVQLDDECEVASWFVARVSVQNSDVKFGQRSPCIVRVTVSGGSNHRLRLARKSLYIELLVPPSGAFQSGLSGGMRVRPFPITLRSGHSSEIQTWNVHYINLSR
ncbi:hypothetical protein BT96DRAFT_922159, partial [Gymnopus androsaceus JB14]